MRSLMLASVAAIAISGCASNTTMRAVQAPRLAPTSSVLFPLDNEYRDAVTLDWIGGVSQHSYLFEKPSQETLRPLIQNALRNSGLEAATPVRARYGLRVLVSEATAPAVATDAHSELVAAYTLVDRRSGQEVFHQVVKTDGDSVYLGLNEHDVRLAWNISEPLTKDVVLVGGVAHLVEHSNADLDSVEGDDWARFWNDWRALPLRTMVAGPAVAGALFVNPFNYLPFASKADERRAQRQEAPDLNDFQGANPKRIASRRSAQAIYRAEESSVAGFLLAFTKDQGVAPQPIFPCHGSPKIEGLKRAALAQGVGFITDDCTIPRSRYANDE